MILFLGSVIGIFIGAFVCKHFSWNCQQILKFVITLSCISTLCMSNILVDCKDNRIVGINAEYVNRYV